MQLFPRLSVRPVVALAVAALVGVAYLFYAFWAMILGILLVAFFAFLFYRAMVSKGRPGRFWSRTVPAWIEAVSVALIARNTKPARGRRRK